jgi:arylformamidase
MRYSLLFILLLALTSCSTKKFKNITYETSVQNNPLQLNIFVPRNANKDKMPVLIYVHGGNWNTGNKNIYGFFGRNFAKKDVITVIPSYTLSPEANYDQMTQEIASVIKWVKAEIGKYGGNSEQVFVTGHSAGGHLVALATMNPKYGVKTGTVAGIILNDAAGLDMKQYLKKNTPTSENEYLTTWTNNPEEWRNASPIYFLNKETPPFLIYVGEKTYPSIKVANERFLKELHHYQKEVQPIMLNKKHIPMILQYFWPWNDRIDETVDFMKTRTN